MSKKPEATSDQAEGLYSELIDLIGQFREYADRGAVGWCAGQLENAADQMREDLDEEPTDG